MNVVVQVYGPLTGEERVVLLQSLQREFASFPNVAEEDEPVILTFPEDLQQGIDEARHPCDIRIYILTKTDDYGEKTRLFEKLINRSPIVPVVFRNREDVDWATLSRDVRRALETSWWGIVRSIDLPVMIVDRSQRIIKANDAALEFFGPGIIGRPYRSAVEGEENEVSLPRDHPVRLALDLDGAAAPPGGSPATAT